MTYASTSLACAPGSWPPSYDHGASHGAFKLRETFLKLRQHFTLAATGQRREERLNAPLEALSASIAEPFKYPEESEQASVNTIREAAQFLRVLSEGIPQPDITIEPNGAIAFEWYKDEKNVFLISANGTGSLEYAALLGPGNEMHGRVNFTGDFPVQLHSLLSAFLSITH